MRTLFCCLAAALSFASLTGCRKSADPLPAAQAPPPKPKPQLAEVLLKSHRPNEAGAIMILMYHRVRATEPDNNLNRRPETFRKDLQTLYEKGYRPVTVSELVDNRMDVPAGKTPVVITFDDALPSQFRVVPGSDGTPKIDPDCAVGIMETFSKTHPDWKTKATFFVLPKEGRNGEPFGQPESVADKFAYLVNKGYEIANHTSTHSSLKRMKPDKIQWEIATAIKDIQAVNPKAEMSTLALPYGLGPAKEHLPYLVQGEDGGRRYTNKAVLTAAWRPVLSPITAAPTGKKKGGSRFARFTPEWLERITPDAAHPNTAGTFEYWLKEFDDNPGLRYISDGDPNICAVPKSAAGLVDRARAQKQGKTVQVYDLSASATGGAGELSVR